MTVFNSFRRVLAIGAHPDDIEIGAGGLVHRLVEEYGAEVWFLVLTEGVRKQGGAYSRTFRRDECFTAAGVLGIPAERVEVLTFADCHLHDHGHEMIQAIEDRLSRTGFDLLLTHAREDTHADHTAVHEATVSAARDLQEAVLTYQAPSTKPNGFLPTFFVRLSEEQIRRKHAAIVAHASQQGRAFTGLHRTRGLACNWAHFLRCPEGTYLEAFETQKAFL